MQRFQGRPRVRSGRSVNISDWEKQSEIVENWNDELCSREALPEVEIISLLEEQIPKYKLRADTLTKFGGYENQDWFIPSPALQVDEADLKLSPDQIRETLNYFLLCSDRVSQMTKTYDDIEAVTRLLEEKEKDLELTARIGKELLQSNNKLENTIAYLENDHRAALEKITQLTHECQKKTELIQILTNDMDDACYEMASNTGKVNLELLNKKISNLQDENKQLKVEFHRLAQDTRDVENQERRLLSDLTGQLSCANSSMGYLEGEIDRLKDETRVQQDLIQSLQDQLKINEERFVKCLGDNEELSSLLQITKDNQGSLAIELSEFKARYYEVHNLLQDAQEQIRKLRKKQQPGARISFFSSLGAASGVAPFDSLHNELEMSLHSELSADSGISESVPQYKKVFETVRCASRSSLSSQDSGTGSAIIHPTLGGTISSSSVAAGYGGSGPRMSFKTQTASDLRRSSGSIYNNSSLGYPSLESSVTSQSDTEFGLVSDSDEGYPAGQSKGIPGIPGATDIEAALKRLTPGEVLARRSNLQFGPAFGGYDGETSVPFGCRTPDSLMSTGSGHYRGWKLPEKLQIVKPMEGSLTLHHWSQLAQPSFAGLLEERPGVKVRGGKELEELGLESYGLEDLEEDEEYSNPGKIFDSSAPTYTMTTSMVMHPDDGTFITPSNRTSRVTSVCSSIQNSPPQTPMLSRRNSCSTFSTTFGLAKMLNERGIKAVTPSAINSPSGPNSFTPTATPCNSPDASPDHSRSSSPERQPEAFSLPQLILSSVPQFLRDSMGGGVKKKTSFRASRRGKKAESIVGRIERIGISNLMGNPGSLSITAGMYARPGLNSPMAQLTCLLPSKSTENLSHIGNKVPPSVHSAPAPAPSDSGMGVPGRPGSGALSRRLEQLNSRKQRRANGVTRPDLGTVSTSKTPEEQTPPGGCSTLGTLSSLLFGRKGGLF
ncbi:trafficking kinesin-binding protein milt isoform X2 [Harmonia axyridis]|uniref:trafficking kinesin-binding protein milt isoform X2 n=1 Tax=Harmonia axyridis TaxID=115357 RepID=UPI001E279443|nr:trafficking kinesin-binding protein milt isoform X2 [Harmonia axyridis]XP_045474166.1 trafficking kinesin-binding protein milt isoform X2 [Harmonia axyridis]